jgi:hypothetical protein
MPSKINCFIYPQQHNSVIEQSKFEFINNSRSTEKRRKLVNLHYSTIAHLCKTIILHHTLKLDMEDASVSYPS